MAGFSTSATPCASSITVFLTSGGLSQSQNALVAPAASVPLKIAARKSRHVRPRRSEEHTSELRSPDHLVCRLLLEKKNKHRTQYSHNNKTKQTEQPERQPPKK